MTVSEAIKAIQSGNIYDDKGFLNARGYEALSALEGADVVEPIRCKDCKWYKPETSECYQDMGAWYPDDYCSDAEREEAES